MSKKAKGTKKSHQAAAQADGRRLITRNRKARHLYMIEDTIEAGMVLIGTEVKSLLAGQATIADSYVKIQNEEAWLLNCHIDEYIHGNRFNHDPTRPRKLLMHKREIVKLDRRLQTKGVTVFLLELYFRNRKAKALLGIGRGKKLYDRREDIKERDTMRDVQRSHRGRGEF